MLVYTLFQQNPAFWNSLLFKENNEEEDSNFLYLQQGKYFEYQIMKHYDVEKWLKSHDVHVKKSDQVFDTNITPNVFVDKYANHDKDVVIHTLSTEIRKDLPNLVFLHGYWSSSLSFVKIIKPLMPYFNIHLIDLPGQALSSRIPFQYTDNNDIINFFIDNIEGWRDKMLQNQKIYLGGHSFGGYLAGHYALKYEKNVEQLFMISPFGLYNDKGEKSVNNNLVYYTFQEQSEHARKIFFYYFDKLWGMHAAVSDMYQKIYFPGKLLLANYLNQTLDKNEVEYDLFLDYYDSIMNLPVSSERCMTSLLKFPQFTAVLPIEEELKKLNIPVHFFYGENDWMECETAKKLVQEKQVNGTFNIISNCGHNIQFDNGEEFSERLIQLCGFE